MNVLSQVERFFMPERGAGREIFQSGNWVKLCRMIISVEFKGKVCKENSFLCWDKDEGQLAGCQKKNSQVRMSSIFFDSGVLLTWFY